MAVARETIVEALKSLLRVEEFSVEFLAEVERYDFRYFTASDVKEIHALLQKLQEDTVLHQKTIQDLIARLGEGGPP